ncbi:Signal transduction histidine kinase [Cyclobacterium qasimii M12-11B]|uniref:Signal transduction histidine kinase n=1 Tax=Cyclobacterium qasimii M12-11B TaxID=641524 RepID=S7WLR9_9BACT|nr:Signal transduction histidine kinase [Cyclobacterium qasimii M12-11B]
MHQGKIAVQSEEGVGTTVSLQLNKTLPKNGNGANSFDYAKSGVFDLENKNVLIVEDNALNQMVLKILIGNWKNSRFEIANNGQEAIDLLKAQPFDVVLMDLQMPVMDGYEATTAIRAGAAGTAMSKVPIIAVTADVTQKARFRVLEVGMDDYMTKPINKEELYNKIKKAIYLGNPEMPHK